MGAPIFLDLFVDFFQELETTKLWFRSNREEHPHRFGSQVPPKKITSALHMEASLGTLKAECSPVFRDYPDAFIELIDHLIITCTKPEEEQLLKYLLEVKILAESFLEHLS